MPRPVSNPPNPWSSTHVEWIDEPPDARLQVFEEEARSIISENESPDVGMRFSVNPYRGCYHGCAYCYARPSHQYLGFGAGTDFERKIVVKTNAAELLRKELLRPGWRGDTIVFSGNTDCYQPLEASYGLTRACLGVCLEFGNPAAIITKSALVRRDLELLSALSRRTRLRVFISIPFFDDEMGRKMEPYAARPSKRLAALRALSGAGIDTGIAVAPLIPGLNDEDIPALLQAGAKAGARRAFMTMVRLPREVLPVFRERIRTSLSEARVRKVEHAILDTRGGRMNASGFGERMSGQGPRWHAIEGLFLAHCRRLGLNQQPADEDGPSTFQRPGGQLRLF